MNANREVKIAAVQFGPSNSVAQNLLEVGLQVSNACLRGADIIVFPEYSSYFDGAPSELAVANAESIDGPFVSGVCELAAAHRVTIVVGLVEKVSGESRFSNTVVAVSDEGSVVAEYRKQHLYDAYGSQESAWVVPGPLAEPQIFNLNGLKFGIQTCYDLRFPEITRAIIDEGADVVLIPAQWVPGPSKERQWSTLIQARAIENTVYVVAADHPGPSGAGMSCIVDPDGTVIAAASSLPVTVCGLLSGSRLDEVRSMSPVIDQRRYRVIEK